MKQIPLYKGYRSKPLLAGYALIDNCFSKEVLKHYWILHEKRPQTRIDGKHVRLHQLVWKLAGNDIPPKCHLDHIDRNTLNNQISNLRVVTPSLNSANKRVRTNKSGYHGVCWLKKEKRWRARVVREGKIVFCASFKNKEEAAYAVNKAYRKYYPELEIPNSIIPKW